MPAARASVPGFGTVPDAAAASDPGPGLHGTSHEDPQIFGRFGAPRATEKLKNNAKTSLYIYYIISCGLVDGSTEKA